MSNGSLEWRCGQKLVRGLAATVVIFAGGCGDFFAQKPAEIETQTILNELKQIPERPEVTNPLPELYREPAKKLRVGEGVKIFYFTKHHSAEKLARLVETQFAAEMKSDGKGNIFYIPKYAITESPATNQLVVDCPTEEEGDKVLEFLEAVDVPPIQVNIDCLIVERFADVTMDWETTILVENLFGEEITLGGKTDSSGNLLAAFPGASLRESKRGEFGLNIGYWRNQGVSGHQFRAVVDMLISRGYLKILMNPMLETVNGQKARIVSRENVPLEKILLKEGFDEPFSLTEYQWVEDILEVTPYVYSDGSIGLKTKVQIGSKSKPEGVVQTSIITERTIDIAENRIKPGKSLVIGGITKTEERVVVRGVPFFKDIPLLGVLFSSKDFEEKGTEVIFILTPSISSGGVKYADMLEQVRDKLASPEYELGLEKVVTDPFGTAAYTELVEQQASEAEFERFKAEIERAEALEDVALVKEKLYKAAEQVLAEKSKTARARSEVEEFREEVAKLKTEAEAERARADEAKKELEQAGVEDARRRLEEAEAAKKALEAESAKARQEAEEVRKALEEAEKAGEQGAEQSGESDGTETGSVTGE